MKQKGIIQGPEQAFKAMEKHQKESDQGPGPFTDSQGTGSLPADYQGLIYKRHIGSDCR